MTEPRCVCCISVSKETGKPACGLAWVPPVLYLAVLGVTRCTQGHHLSPTYGRQMPWAQSRGTCALILTPHARPCTPPALLNGHLYKQLREVRSFPFSPPPSPPSPSLRGSSSSAGPGTAVLSCTGLQDIPNPRGWSRQAAKEDADLHHPPDTLS